jgi:hypothetical protein
MRVVKYPTRDGGNTLQGWTSEVDEQQRTPRVRDCGSMQYSQPDEQRTKSHASTLARASGGVYHSLPRNRISFRPHSSESLRPDVNDG